VSALAARPDPNTEWDGFAWVKRDYRQCRFMKPKDGGPPNHGLAWSHEAEQELLDRYFKHYPLTDLASHFGRTLTGITSRLEKLGIDLSDANRNKPAKLNIEEPMMKDFQHLFALLQTGYTTVAVVFDGDQAAFRTYTYKVPKGLADTLVKGDLLVVPARNEFKLVKVHEVHAEPEIDVTKPLALKWIVQKVDMTAYLDQTEREAQAVLKVQKAERAQAQQKALETLLGSVEDREALLQLIAVPQA
jgi:hypothetical protein